MLRLSVATSVALLGTLALAQSGLGAVDKFREQGDVWKVSVSVGTAMTSAILISGALGLCMPFLFKRKLGIDPAIATGPVITTVNDATSAVIYLFIASVLLGSPPPSPSGPTTNTSQPALKASVRAP